MKVFHYDTTPSTMDQAKQLLQNDFHEEFAVLAKAQTSGRGRHGREWQSPAGNLYLSIATHDVAPNQLSQYALLWGLVIQQVVASHVSAVVSCKWPNDVLVDGRKVSGILIERNSDPSALIVGIGMNILHRPENVMFPATRLADHAQPPAADELTAQIISTYQTLRSQWEENSFDAIRSKWLEHAWKLGEEIKIGKNNESMVGIFETIDDNGALILNTGGIPQKLFAGDLIGV